MPVPVILNKFIGIIPIASNDSYSYPGEKALLVDWYRARKGFKQPLKASILQLIRNQRCSFMLNVEISESMICTIPLRRTINGCTDHPGAPLILNGQLIGIVSYANRYCENGDPLIYSNVRYYWEWINEIINKSA